MMHEKICLNVTDDTEIEVLNYQACDGSGCAAFIDFAIGPIVIRGVHVSDGREINSQQCVDLPQDVVLSKEAKEVLSGLALFSHIVKDCPKVTFAELKSGAAYIR